MKFVNETINRINRILEILDYNVKIETTVQDYDVLEIKMQNRKYYIIKSVDLNSISHLHPMDWIKILLEDMWRQLNSKETVYVLAGSYQLSSEIGYSLTNEFGYKCKVATLRNCFGLKNPKLFICTSYKRNNDWQEIIEEFKMRKSEIYYRPYEFEEEQRQKFNKKHFF